uniref:Uncharacterized protein n=1 Tax=uncultured Bacteroidota bacterium TaxID=152509 RepID=H5SMB3_9BACT|nr:hypothetical protein HGMM_F50B04C25 [uncultured Bacteroidetes bacterium]
MKRWVLAIVVGGCASIKAPDGGPPDRMPPQVRSIRTKNQGKALLLSLHWDEFLAPASALSGTGVWTNPPLPFKAKLRGKRIWLRIDSLPAGCFTVWGGPGLRDFTEGNPFPPAPLWHSCPTPDSLQLRWTLLPPPQEKTDVWAELWKDSLPYRFLAWKGQVEAAFLPPGTYRAWAWEDKDQNQTWSIDEAVWLPDSAFLRVEGADSLPPKSAAAGPPWRRWVVDTLPPSLPRPQQTLPGIALLVFKEPVVPLRLPSGSRQLSEYALEVPMESILTVADSAGNPRTDTLTMDTTAYKPRLFFPIQANLRFPQLYFTLSRPLPDKDTFWVGRDGGIAALFLRDREVYAEPLSLSQEVPLTFIWEGQETLQVQVPACKFLAVLPVDSSGAVVRWRIYGPSVLGLPMVAEAAPGDSVWLPPGSYTLLGLAESGPFWQPIGLQEGKPYLRQPFLRRENFQLPPPN